MFIFVIIPILLYIWKQFNKRILLTTFSTCATVNYMSNTILIFCPRKTYISLDWSAAYWTFCPDFFAWRSSKIRWFFTFISIIVPILINIRDCIGQNYFIFIFCWMTFLTRWNRKCAIFVFSDKSIHFTIHFCMAFWTIEIKLLFWTVTYSV